MDSGLPLNFRLTWKLSEVYLKLIRNDSCKNSIQMFQHRTKKDISWVSTKYFSRFSKLPFQRHSSAFSNTFSISWLESSEQFSSRRESSFLLVTTWKLFGIKSHAPLVSAFRICPSFFTSENIVCSMNNRGKKWVFPPITIIYLITFLIMKDPPFFFNSRGCHLLLCTRSLATWKMCVCRT